MPSFGSETYMQNKKLKQRILCLCSTAFLMSNQIIPAITSAEDKPLGLLKDADPADVQLLKKYYTDEKASMPIPMEVFSRDIKLSEYEVLLLSELIRLDIEQSIRAKKLMPSDINTLVDLQNKYADAYPKIFQRVPPKVQSAIDEVKNNPNNINPMFAREDSSEGQIGNTSFDTSGFGGSSFPMPNGNGFTPPPSPVGNNSDVQGQPNELINNTDSSKNFQQQIQNASTPEELTDAMSLINIRKTPSTTPTYTSSMNNTAITPLSEFEGSDMATVAASSNVSGIDRSSANDTLGSLAGEVSDALMRRSIDNGRKIYLYAEHFLTYVDTSSEGNSPLNKNKLDDNGNYYQRRVGDEYQLEDTLRVGVGIQVHKALDILLGMVGKNENGMLWGNGTTWEFGDVMFRFHPERLKPKVDTGGVGVEVNGDGGAITSPDGKTRVEVDANGRRVAVSHGNTQIRTDAEGREIGITVGDTTVEVDSETGAGYFANRFGKVAYDPSSGLQVSNPTGKYFLGFGKLSLNLSDYTLKLSDVRAVQVGYQDDDQKLAFIYGRPKKAKEGYDETEIVGGTPRVVRHPGTYQSIVRAVQYMTRTLIPNTELTFNFARAEDRGTLTTPNGAKKELTKAYSVTIQGEQGQLRRTSYDGEFAHAENYTYDGNGFKKSNSANAQYLTLTRQFTERLNGSLFLVNIDKNYNTGALTEDKTGDYTYANNKGDGLPDYPYKVGQKGFDLSMNYDFQANAGVGFGYSRYSRTEDANSKTTGYLSGYKDFDLSNPMGEVIGRLRVSEVMQYAKVSNKDYIQRVYNTQLAGDVVPWKDGRLTAEYQDIRDKAKGNQKRFNMELSHDFYPLNRVTVTPDIRYERKKGEKGLEADSKEIDSSSLVTSLTVGYELVPDELTVNVLISKERYDVISSEIDRASGKKIDGEKRNVLGMGIGFAWEPSKIPGLTASISYRRDKVHYFTPQDKMSNQDVWDMNVEYERPIGSNMSASISYNYHAAKDKINPIYNEVTRTVDANIYAQLGNGHMLTLRHEYNMVDKPIDPKASYKEHVTTIQMSNKF